MDLDLFLGMVCILAGAVMLPSSVMDLKDREEEEAPCHNRRLFLCLFGIHDWETVAFWHDRCRRCKQDVYYPP